MLNWDCPVDQAGLRDGSALFELPACANHQVRFTLAPIQEAGQIRHVCRRHAAELVELRVKVTDSDI
jgi:hypothetical protein